jgi:hypothetical protein
MDCPLTWFNYGEWQKKGKGERRKSPATPKKTTQKNPAGDFSSGVLNQKSGGVLLCWSPQGELRSPSQDRQSRIPLSPFLKQARCRGLGV